MSRADGLAGLVRAAAAAPLPAAPEAQQDDLFVPPIAQRPGESAEAFAAREASAVAAVKRGPGRPRGAQSLHTREMRDYALRMNGGVHPFVEGMRWLAMGPDGIRQQLGCTAAEAFDRWERLRDSLTPYFMPKLAPVDEKGNAVMPSFTFTLNGEADAGPGPGIVPPWERRRAEVVDVEAAPAPARPADAEPPVSDAARAAYELMRPGDEGATP